MYFSALSASHGALEVLREALGPGRDWQDQVERAMAAYFDCLARSPALIRTLFIEILGLGAEGLAARHRMNDESADFMLHVVKRSRSRQPLSRDMAMAVVVGVNELVLNTIETGQVDQLRYLATPPSSSSAP